MSTYNHLDVSERNGVTITRFKSNHFLLCDECVVRDIGVELDTLAGQRDGPRLIVDFVGVEDLSSLMLGKLVRLRTKMAGSRGKLFLCGFSPEVREFLTRRC